MEGATVLGGVLRCGWGQAASLPAMSWLLGLPVVRIAPVAAAVVGRARSAQVIIPWAAASDILVR